MVPGTRLCRAHVWPAPPMCIRGRTLTHREVVKEDKFMLRKVGCDPAGAGEQEKGPRTSQAARRHKGGQGSSVTVTSGKPLDLAGTDFPICTTGEPWLGPGTALDAKGQVGLMDTSILPHAATSLRQ